MLLERGADIDARDADHRATAAEWMLAGRRGAGRYTLAGYLVERDAAADIFLAIALGLTDRRKDPTFGGTPLGWCVHGAVHCRDAAVAPAAVARLLVAAGADAAPFIADAPDALRAVFEETGPPGQGAR